MEIPRLNIRYKGLIFEADGSIGAHLAVKSKEGHTKIADFRRFFKNLITKGKR